MPPFVSVLVGWMLCPHCESAGVGEPLQMAPRSAEAANFNCSHVPWDGSWLVLPPKDNVALVLANLACQFM